MSITKSENRLPPGQHLVAPGKWPFIGEKLPRQSDQPWTLTIAGIVQSSQTFTLAELESLPQTEMQIDIHCVTRWSKYDVCFSGVLLADLLEKTGQLDRAKFASFVARSDRQHSTSLPLSTALDLETMIALKADGRPLAIEHGGPIRSIVPHRYFYKSVKWVEKIELIEKDFLGFWERDAGYHNEADPWREQRYVSQTIDKRQARNIIESRDFSGLDLLSIDLCDRELSGLNATGALMRNANCRGANLTGANFTGCNLSNANFVDANLTNAIFIDADLEGADLAGANLSGVNFTNCSLFGSTFCRVVNDSKNTISQPARFDANTIIDEKMIEVLTPIQFEFVQTQIRQFR